MCDEIGGYSNDVFKNMKSIRLLNIYHDFTSTKPTTLPDELRWLTWYEYPFSSLPVGNLRKLVGLEIEYGNIEHLWIGYKFLPNLKFIHLQWLGCIESFPDVSGAPNVESLILYDCTNLMEVHKSLGTLRKLAYLNMTGCYNLKYLPSMIEMESLETLILSSCFMLEKFPEVSSRVEKLSNIYLRACPYLKIIPNSICELKNLKVLDLQECRALQHLPEELGSMEKLEELWLGSQNPNCLWPSDIISFHTWTKLCCLRKLDLSCRQIEEHDFPNDFHAFSSLEELYLSDNSKLVHLPASISHLSRLKHLELNECQHLRNIQGLPSGIQVLKASNCSALEEIEDLTEEYVSLHKIFLPGCERLLENQENLDKMLQQSFVKKCAAGDHVLSIRIPGSKIPSWFKEQQLGNHISLKLPPEWHTDIKGFVVCGVFQGKWPRVRITCATQIKFKFGINATLMPELEVDIINAFAVNDKLSIWIVYVPFSLYQQQTYDDSNREGNLLINISEPLMLGKKAVRCGAHIMYKEDVESMHQIGSCIHDYQDFHFLHDVNDGTVTYAEKES
ncbi:Leucine-rich repeat-containing protein [Cynara cardunculus var. scolymus]|uniref:Leucine-rich repeat-containing protein n=2 Tax=Cynara cardunculus var. scolymus TaxID=59895 RepID=A0A103YEU8_CYNCS|nr:Leucine-rich repeat-containing protein [Cynara cardunculus var. scolymus]